MKLIIWTDGGITKDNKENHPCYFAYYARIEDTDKEFCSRSKIGIGTSNQAEYRGMLLALSDLPEMITQVNTLEPTSFSVEFRSDSKIMVNQINRSYKTKDPKLILLRKEVFSLLEFISLNIPVTVTHIKREFNSIADLLCNLAKKGILKDNPFTSLTDFKQQHNLHKYKALKGV